MGHLKSIDLPEPTTRANERQAGSSRPWIWVVVAAVAIGGFWYYRSSHSSKDGQSSASAAAPGSGGSGRGGRAGGANFTVPVVVSTAIKGDLPVYLNGLGTVTPLNTVTVRSRVDGQLINVAFKEGQYVKTGDLLAEIDPRPFQVQLEQAEGQLAKDVAQRKDAEANLERYKLLYQEGVIPKQQLDTQAASVGQFDGAIKTDQGQIDNAKLQLTYARITSPITGRVGLRLVDPGNIVHATDTTGLVIITQVQPIAVIFTLPQDQLQQVFDKIHKGVQLGVEAYDRDNTQKIASGKLLTIDNQIDTTTGTYKLKAVFSNDDNILFPNQFVNTHLLVDTKRNLSLVPLAAIQRGPQGTYVYVVGEGNTVKIQNITVAQSTGATVGISNGLEAGQVVVIDGQDKLQEGTKVVPNRAPAAAAVAGAAGTDATSSPASAPTPNAVRQPAQPQKAQSRKGAKP
ncbi:MAG TPA: MdtA/MuxA family multidrug efflux RND transporter periplasmic adaptor subunit [Candidatus Acidoferrum sp.]|nr:MdtA/MuxA family multidrug efflux RND transporter periplasmic adaptor subunit [Candidatus Acidoferrum sp.]